MTKKRCIEGRGRKKGNQLTLARNLIVYDACMLQPITRTRSRIMLPVINMNVSKCDEKSAELYIELVFLLRSRMAKCEILISEL